MPDKISVPLLPLRTSPWNVPLPASVIEPSPCIGEPAGGEVERISVNVEVPSWIGSPKAVATTWKERVIDMVIAPVDGLSVPIPPPAWLTVTVTDMPGEGDVETEIGGKLVIVTVFRSALN